jgi:hypothetical protein
VCRGKYDALLCDECVAIIVDLSVYLSLFLCLSIYVSLSLSFSIYLSSLSLFLSVSLLLSLSLSLSLALSLSPSLSLSIYLYLSLSLCLPSPFLIFHLAVTLALTTTSSLTPPSFPSCQASVSLEEWLWTVRRGTYVLVVRVLWYDVCGMMECVWCDDVCVCDWCAMLWYNVLCCHPPSLRFSLHPFTLPHPTTPLSSLSPPFLSLTSSHLLSSLSPPLLLSHLILSYQFAHPSHSRTYAEKSTYHTLNLFKNDVAGNLLRGRGWVLSRSIAEVCHLLSSFFSLPSALFSLLTAGCSVLAVSCSLFLNRFLLAVHC